MIYQFRKGSSWLHRLDPGSKFLWVMSVSLLCFRYEEASRQAGLLLIVTLFGLFAAKLSPKAIWRGLRLPFWFGVPYFLLQLLFVPADYAAAVSMRLITVVFASLLLIATTDPRDVVLALCQQLRVPYRFAFAVAIALRFIPILEAEAEFVRSAQRLRGGGHSGRKLSEKLAEYRRFTFTVFVNAIRRVQETAETMESRAFGLSPTRTYRRRITVPISGVCLSAGSLLCAAAALISLH